MDTLVRNCLQDPEVIDLIRNITRATRAVVTSDEEGNQVHLLEEPDGGLVSPYDSGICLVDTTRNSGDGKRLVPMAEKLAGMLDQGEHPYVQVRVPFYFVERHGHSILEPFLAHRFAASVERWERAVDLTQPVEAIFSGYVKGHKQSVTKTIKRKLACRILHNEMVDDQTMQSFYDAMVDTRQRSGTELAHPASTFFEDRRQLISKGKAALAVVVDGDTTSFLFALVSREYSLYLDGASAGGSATANHFVQHQTMLFLKEVGSEHYSLGYVYPNILSDNPKYAGIAYFKNGFGGRLHPVYQLTISRVKSAPAKPPRNPAWEFLHKMKKWARARMT